MIVVICCNVMKAVCMALTVFLNKDTLVTVGYVPYYLFSSRLHAE